jgi:hypothetical protein
MTREEFIEKFNKSPYSFETVALVACHVQDAPLRKAAKRYVEAKGNLRRIIKAMGMEIKDE